MAIVATTITFGGRGDGLGGPGAGPGGAADGLGGLVKGLLVAGTTSDAGKSVVTAGICRWLVRRGVKVAPFKGQNMSLNSFVTRDGAEIGRAQARRLAWTGLMNPVLLKPGGDRTSQVVLLGKPVGELSARGFFGAEGTGRGLAERGREAL